MHIGVDEILSMKGGPHSTGLLHAYIDLIAKEVSAFNSSFREECRQTVEPTSDTTITDTTIPSIAESSPECADVSTLHTHAESELDARCFAAALRRGARDGVQELRESLQLSAAGRRIPYQDCIIAMSIQGVLRYMWSTLGPEEQTVFASQYETLFQVYVNAMPAESAVAVLERVDAGGCFVHGELRSIQAVDNFTFRLHFTDAGGDHASDSADSKDRQVMDPFDVQYVINASGFNTSYTSVANTDQSSLYCSMIDDGLIIPHVRGGLRADFTTGRVCIQESKCSLDELNASVDTTKSPCLYAVGYPLKGEKLAVSGLSYCVSDAVAAVKSCLSTIHN